MEEVRIKAERRKETGKGVARKLRQQGKIPAVLYGRDTEPLPLSIMAKEWSLAQTHMKSNTILKIEIGENGSTLERPAMIKEIQRAVTQNAVLHIDFLQVSMERAVQVEVPIHIVGQSVGVTKGGVVEQHLRTIMIESLPGQIPDNIEVDISALDIGDSLHVHQISVSGIKFLELPEVAVVGITPPEAEEKPAAAEAEAEAEPKKEE